jgi:hypothetical protein
LDSALGACFEHDLSRKTAFIAHQALAACLTAH